MRGYTLTQVTPAIKHGQNKESKVRRDYARYHIKTCGNHINIEEQGIILSHKYPFYVLVLMEQCLVLNVEMVSLK